MLKNSSAFSFSGVEFTLFPTVITLNKIFLAIFNKCPVFFLFHFLHPSDCWKMEMFGLATAMRYDRRQLAVPAQLLSTVVS